MTREEHQTERALVEAENNWLVARGWTSVEGNRYVHRYMPKVLENYVRREALTMTRAEPLRFKKALWPVL